MTHTHSFNIIQLFTTSGRVAESQQSQSWKQGSWSLSLALQPVSCRCLRVQHEMLTPKCSISSITFWQKTWANLNTLATFACFYLMRIVRLIQLEHLPLNVECRLGGSCGQETSFVLSHWCKLSCSQGRLAPVWSFHTPKMYASFHIQPAGMNRTYIQPVQPKASPEPTPAVQVQVD